MGKLWGLWSTVDTFPQFKPNNTLFFICHRTYPALETLTEPHQLTATLSCMIGVARSLVSGGQRFPEGPTHMLPLLMRALPGVDPNDFSKCMVRSHNILIVMFRWGCFSRLMHIISRVCRSHSSSLLHLWLSYLWWTARLSSTRERIWLRWATFTAVNKHRTFISCIYKWYNLCALGGKRDVLSISWVWRFRAAVHGQVPVCSWLCS